MRQPRGSSVLHLISGVVLAFTTGVASAAVAQSNPASTLLAAYASLKRPLAQSPFKRPLVLDSAESSSRMKSDLYAIADYPFALVKARLNNPKNWCDVMILHINTKYCRAEVGSSGTRLKVNIGKKTPEDLADVPQVEFNYSVPALAANYFEVDLSAQDGPLGTRDFLIQLEAVALPNSKTFLHFTYSYTVNFAGRLALEAYLATVGSDKVGFTVIGTQSDGQPEYVSGIRGLMERNTMRYYLAIDSYLGASRTAPAVRFEKSMQNWYTATDRYPRQLRDMERQEYVEMKRAEYVRQQAVY